jgi:predicted lysophospholipase L1 biosynthesis ABC-type transport system permease subunit
VIGIAEGVRSESLAEQPGMDLYLSNQQQFAGDTFFAVRVRREGTELNGAVARAIQEVDPEQPVFDVQPLATLIEDTVWQRRIAGRLSLWFGVLALLLAAIGTYSVIAYAVSQRTRELGIRHALGSTPRQLQQLVVREGMKLAAAGLAIGTSLGAAVAVAIAKLLYGVQPLDAQTFLSTAVIVAAAAMLACYIPARRASAVDPAVALRYE